jgi:LuxR family maltose regulon positive regulatory protein
MSGFTFRLLKRVFYNQLMLAPILTTKLYIPSPRINVVLRSQLLERLNESLHCKLTLVSAPAGFGKTTLVSEWTAAHNGPVAWLSLDVGDNNPARFWSHFIVALQTVASYIGAEALGALQSPQPPSTESILTLLLNEIILIPEDLILVLDDYHLVDSKQIDDALAFLIERLPPHMHLVIVTREDPDLPLARWRARDHLIELRVKDLRFTESEAAEFLNQAMGLRLLTEDIAALEARTEGWIAGLQLAAISMQGHQGTAEFIKSFTGSHRFVMDYLVEEVLQQQPETIQAFLLQTSILDRMCGQLCDAVLLNSSITGQETLEYLERANLFIIPLDNERRWYRYHHLFAELLRNRLDRAYPDQIADLHRRASDWYASNNLPNEAIGHALEIHDWQRAAELIEGNSRSMWLHGEIGILRAWLESFPAGLRLERIKLGLVYAWTLTMANELDRAEQHLDQMMPLVQPVPALLGELLAVRVMIAAYRSDMPAVIKLAEQSMSLMSPEELTLRSMIMLSLGVAHYDMSSDIASTRRAFRAAYELSKAFALSNSPGKDPSVLVALAYLAELEWLQGNLRDASRMYEQALELSEQWGGQVSLARVHWGRASLFYEWNDLDSAAHALQESIRSGELWKDPHVLVHSYGLSAVVMQARGQTDDARAMIRRAEQITRDWYSSPPTLGSLAVYQIVVWIAQNDFQAIAQWEQSHDSGWRSQIGRARDNLAIVLAHARIARRYRQRDNSALSQARALIEPALEQAQASGLIFNVVRLLILDALALYAQGETAPAITAFKRALAFAEPENYVRSFLDIGKPMQEFLSWSLESQSLTEPQLRVYVSKLIDHFGAAIPIGPGQPIGNAPIEPLTDRELEVLRLIAQGLSNREIGERLFLALSTVKGYNRIIFDKLQVQRRTEAIARARELGLL